MFYKFGDNTKTKTVIKKESKEDSELKTELKTDVEILDENDDTNRRSAIIKKYNEKEKEENE